MKKPRWLLIAEAVTALLPSLVTIAATVVAIIQETKTSEDGKESV